MKLFSLYRRDLLGRMFFDLVKVGVGAALASRFFFEFGQLVQGLLIGSIFALGLLGLLVCPDKSLREGGS